MAPDPHDDTTGPSQSCPHFPDENTQLEKLPNAHSGCFGSPPGSRPESGPLHSHGATSQLAVLCAGTGMGVRGPFLPSKSCSACCSECRARRGAVVHTLPTSSRPCKGKGTPPGDGSALREILGPTQCGDAPTKCTSGPLFPAHERGWSRGAAHGLAPPEARPAPGRGGWQRAPPVAHTEMAALHIEKERGRLPV